MSLCQRERGRIFECSGWRNIGSHGFLSPDLGLLTINRAATSFWEPENKLFKIGFKVHVSENDI